VATVARIHCELVQEHFCALVGVSHLDTTHESSRAVFLVRNQENGDMATARATRPVCTSAAVITVQIPPDDGTAKATRDVTITGVPLSRIKQCHQH